MKTIIDLGTIGTVGTVLRPIDLTLERSGAVWVLTGYTSPEITVWDIRTHTELANPGTVTVQTAASGIVRWVPGTGIYAASGTFEARVTLVPGTGNPPEPAGRFRFNIAGL